MAKLVVKNGQLYNERGEKQVLEFGNVDQIKVIKEYANLQNAFLNEGFELDLDFTVTVNSNFKCTCGRTLYVEKEIPSEDAIEFLDAYTVSCVDCSEEYELNVNDNDDVVVVKKVTHD